MTRNVKSSAHRIISWYAGYVGDAGYNFASGVISGGTSNGIHVQILQRGLSRIWINLIAMISADDERRVYVINRPRGKSSCRMIEIDDSIDNSETVGS